MKVWHIIPKHDVEIPFDDQHPVCIEEICAFPTGKKWKVRTQSAYEISDMNKLRQAVCSKLALAGDVDVEHQVVTVHHGGAVPSQRKALTNTPKGYIMPPSKYTPRRYSP